jgi:hypothetical protein
MIDCTFVLNGEPMSVFVAGAAQYPAFSGIGDHINKPNSACIKDLGPIPRGTYYIIDRQSGGLLGGIRDMLTGRDEWFALYTIDGNVDDKTFCEKIERGQFRLHPKGTLGISYGCIVINKKSDFDVLRAKLKHTNTIKIPSSELLAYGKVVVR